MAKGKQTVTHFFGVKKIGKLSTAEIVAIKKAFESELKSVGLHLHVTYEGQFIRPAESWEV